MSPPQPQLPGPIVHAVAGGLGGVISLIFTYPLDIIKTRLQVQSRFAKDTTDYKGTFDAIIKIVKHQGVIGLYRGLTVGLIHTLINQFVYFYFYEWLKPLYQKTSGTTHLTSLMQLLLGIHAASLNCLVTIPIAVVSTRIQTSLQSKDGIVATFGKIVEEDGIQGLWKGLQPSLILTINPAITQLVYEKLKEWLELRLRATDPKAHLSALHIFVIAAIAKSISTVVTYPYIMAKVRLQWKSTISPDLQYRGTLDVLSKVLKTEGFFGLFKGMTPQLVKGVLAQAILFLMKEEIMHLAIKLIAFFYSKKATPIPSS